MTMAASIEWQEGVRQAWVDVAAFVPRAAVLAVVLLAGWVVGGLAAGAVRRALHGFHAACLLERAGLGVGLARVGVADPVPVIASLVRAGVVLLALQLGLSAFGPNAVSSSIDSMLRLLPRIVVAFAIIVATGLAARFLRRVVAGTFANSDLARPLADVTAVAAWVIGCFAALDQLAVAEDIVRMLFAAIVFGTTAIAVIKFGVGGVWAARDRFWPAVYDRVGAAARPQAPPVLDLRRKVTADRPQPPKRVDPTAR